ncbi:protein that induces appearance of [PIN+] prion when overproduced [Candidozyma auris]|uniref:SH3 domain-containing protein n=2 Tax=Candidozyma auris TaxID=498019 RepID=A0A2H0ZK82_CANAR|nr:hypothetical protein QG37_04403 [[Candida] auris]PIS50632.1 hypothetical protein B9J08_004460 [[Candida] auris]QWW25660.1 hypothetical protein CA7LBN_004547 [[Candida] auris]
MSAALINRSLTNIRTELEFLVDSEVIDEKLMAALSEALPPRYSKGMETWGPEKLRKGAEAENSDVAKSDEKNGGDVALVSQKLSETSIQEKISPPANAVARLPPRKPAAPVGFCKALYNYEPQEKDDLRLVRDDKLAVVEHLSSDWWKGYKQGEGPDRAGVFPSNYVSVISESEFEQSEKAQFENRYASPSPAAPPYDQVVPQPTYPQYPVYNNGGFSPQGQQMQPSYGGYAQYPPPSTNYYPQQQLQQQPQEQQVVEGSSHHGKAHDEVKKFGGKLGNAAIFGAGATIGSNIVNSIF